MTSNQWQVTSDNWPMTSDNWQVTNDKYKMTSDKWQIKSDKWLNSDHRRPTLGSRLTQISWTGWASFSISSARGILQLAIKSSKQRNWGLCGKIEKVGFVWHFLSHLKILEIGFMWQQNHLKMQKLGVVAVKSIKLC